MSTELYAKITDQIIAALEKSQAGDYEMPWHNSGKSGFKFPVNVTSKRFYRGINTVVLLFAGIEKGYSSSKWGTFKQWKELGAHVKKGSKATEVVLWKPMVGTPKSKQVEDKQDKKPWLMMRLYYVFNADQVEGYEDPDVVVNSEAAQEARIEAAEAFFSRVGAEVSHGGDRAFYAPSMDRIHMPEFNQFKSPEAYYSVRAHESAHWTGAKNRLDRDMSGRFGDASYAMEELIAELSAAFTMGGLGLSTEPRPDHAQYIKGWLTKLKEDPKAIFTAAGKAQAATDYLVSLQGEVAKEEVAELAEADGQ